MVHILNEVLQLREVFRLAVDLNWLKSGREHPLVVLDASALDFQRVEGFFHGVAMPRIDEKHAVRLLRIYRELSERHKSLSEFGVCVEGLSVFEEILDTLIDSYGFPVDNSPTEWRPVEEGQPVFCRDPIVNVYSDTVVNGTDEEFLRVLETWDEMSRDMTRFYWTDNFHH